MSLVRHNTSRKQIEKHGDTRGDGFREREYVCWTQIIQRCTNPDSKAYCRYGGRGIKVCRRWRNSYVAFRCDMGRKPSSGHSIERIDNNGNYEPSNCRWSLRREQARNKRSNNNVTAFGKKQCVTDWSEACKISVSTLANRLRRGGWSPEEALTVPVTPHLTTLVTVGDETMSLSGWSKRSGIPAATIGHRLRQGWESEMAIFGAPGIAGVGRKARKALTVNGITMSIEDWSKEIGLNRTTIEERLARGWSVEEAVMRPKGFRRS